MELNKDDAMKEALKRKRARGLDLTILLDSADKMPKDGPDAIHDQSNEKTSDLAPEVNDDPDEAHEMGMNPIEDDADEEQAEQAADKDMEAPKKELGEMHAMTKHLGHDKHGLKGAAHKHWLSKLMSKKKEV